MHARKHARVCHNPGVPRKRIPKLLSRVFLRFQHSAKKAHVIFWGFVWLPRVCGARSATWVLWFFDWFGLGFLSTLWCAMRAWSDVRFRNCAGLYSYGLATCGFGIVVENGFGFSVWFGGILSAFVAREARRDVRFGW